MKLRNSDDRSHMETTTGRNAERISDETESNQKVDKGKKRNAMNSLCFFRALSVKCTLFKPFLRDNFSAWSFFINHLTKMWFGAVMSRLFQHCTKPPCRMATGLGHGLRRIDFALFSPTSTSSSSQSPTRSPTISYRVGARPRPRRLVYIDFPSHFVRMNSEATPQMTTWARRTKRAKSRFLQQVSFLFFCF